MPSLILIRPTAWSQYTNVSTDTDRANRFTNGRQNSGKLCQMHVLLSNMTSYYHSVATISLPCIMSETQDDTSLKSLFYPPHLHLVATGISPVFGVRKQQSVD